VERDGGVRDDILLLFVSVQINYLAGHDTLLYLGIRGLNDAKTVDARIHGQAQDQTDVRAFRSVDWAKAAVVRWVYVAHFEGSARAGKAAGAEGRESTEALQLCQDVLLWHELRQLVGGEEFLDSGLKRTRVDYLHR